MMRKRRTRAFTLVELVIVIIILGILATLAMPQFISVQKEADLATLRENTAVIRNAIQLYYVQHNFYYPGYWYVDGTRAWTSEEKNEAWPAQMFGWTNVDGVVAGPGDSREDFPFGPYLQGELPINPIKGNNDIKVKNGLINPWGDDTEGWLVSTSSGAFMFNGLHDLFYDLGGLEKFQMGMQDW